MTRRRGAEAAARQSGAAAGGQVEAARKGRLQQSLVNWFERHQRPLPWRKTRDPYAVWVSEVMLQQTQVKTVLGYYERWMARFPSVSALARAAEADVLHAWQGLGYYSRARRLLAGARAVEERHGGALPRNPTALLLLPGIGPYSAGAIASIAFGLPEPIVDGNVVRVLSRLFALQGDPTRAPLKAKLWELARELVPATDASRFNQGLMELGATICSPLSPRCTQCPLARDCDALAQGLEQRLPELPARKPKTAVKTACALLRQKGSALLQRLPSDAPRWAGLWVLPFVELREGESEGAGAERALGALGVQGNASVVSLRSKHTITRFQIELSVVDCELARGAQVPATDALRFVRASELAGLALPAVHARVLRALMT